MGKPDIFPLSGETRQLLNGQGHFFRAVSELHGETQLSLKGGDTEARVERLEENGEIQVSFVYPLDDNLDPADGRIYLRDRFTFGAAKEEFKSFDRSFEYPGQDPVWSGRLRAFRAFAPPATANVEEFSRQIARRYTGPSPWRRFDDKLIEALKNQGSYLIQAGQLAVDLNASWRLKIGDAQTHFTIDETADTTRVTLRFVVDNDPISSNGRVWLEERFSLDKATRGLKDYSRVWRLSPDTQSTPEWEAVLRRLNQAPAPDQQAADQFIQGLLSVLPLPVPPPLPPTDLNRLQTSKFSARAAAKQATLGPQRQAVKETLEVLQAVELERILGRADASKGWFSGPELDAAKLQALTEKIFLRAKEALEAAEPRGPMGAARMKPMGSAFEILATLPLDPAEALVRDAWLEDRLLQEIDAAGQELSPELRGEHFLFLARHDLLRRGWFQAARAIALKYQQGPSAPKAKALLANLEGKGSFGERVEFFATHGVESLTAPSGLVAMILAGTAGPAFELLGLKFLGRFGVFGRFGAASFGTASEALAFTTFHKAGESFSHDPARVFANFWGEGASTTLLFGGMRLAHAGSANLTARASKSAWAQNMGFSRTLPAGELAPALMTAHERFLMNFPNMELTRSGRLLHGGLGHLSGVTGMLGAGVAARGLGLQEDTSLGPLGIFSETLLFYLQASIGYHLANRLTAGQWRHAVAEIKGRQQAYLDGGKDTQGKQPRLSTAILFDLNLLPLNQPISQGASFRLEPHEEIFLDRILFGGRSNKIKLALNQGGEPFIWDERKPSLLPLRLQRLLGSNEAMSLPLLVNSQPVPKNKWYQLGDADLISLSGRHFGIGALYQAPLKQKFFRLPPPSRQAILQLFTQARTVSELVQSFKAGSLLMTPDFFAHLIEVFQGRQPLQSLPGELIAKTQELMSYEIHLAKLADHPLESSDLKPELQNSRWSPVEKDYQKAKALERLAFQVRQSSSLQDLREFLIRGPLEKIDGYEAQALAEKIWRIEQRSENGLQDLPPAMGIRQRVRDLLEQSVYEEFSKNNGVLYRGFLHQDPVFQLEFNRLRDRKALIYRRANASPEFHTPDKVYHPGEIKEMLDQVLERGKPLVLLPERYGFRQDAENYLQEAERIARLHFPSEMTASVNPFTGELVSLKFRESTYRLAAHLIQHHSGQPVLGIPTIKETERLGNLVMTYLGADGESGYVLDQAQLRHHIDHATPAALRMLRQATPADKALILDSYFGGYRRRDISGASAFQLSKLMGESGIYREVGVTYEFNGNSMRPTLSLGDLHWVSPQRLGDFFAIHTHPEEYLTPNGEIMGIGAMGGGREDYAQKTMVLTGDNFKISSDTRNILPSNQDLEIYLSDAKRYWLAGFPKKFGDTPLFDANERVYKNWVINSWGGSEVKIDLNERGNPVGVKIRYAFKGEVEPADGEYQHSIQRLSDLAQSLKVPAVFDLISYRELSRGMPFEMPTVSGYYFHFKKGPKVHTVGRNPEVSDAVILDQAISGSHLEFTHRDGVWMVADSGSSNGAQLNGRWIQVPGGGRRGNWHPLQDGDVLSIGRIKLRFSVDEFNEGMNLTQVLD